MIEALPTEDSIPIKDISQKITFIYGERKIGKTTFCSQAPDALFIATEPGQSHLHLRKVEVSSWLDFCQVFKLIKDGDHDRKTIVIDTIDNLYRFCFDYVLKKNDMARGTDENNTGYKLVNDELFRAINKLSLLPYGLMMIGHSTEKQVKTRTGKETKIASALSSGALKVVAGVADYILYTCVEEITSEEGSITGYQHVIHTKPTTIYEAGVRLGPDDPDIPDTLPLNYNAFSKALLGEQITEEDWIFKHSK